MNIEKFYYDEQTEMYEQMKKQQESLMQPEQKAGGEN